HRETHKSGGGNFPDRFKVEEKTEYVVKFVDDDFFITYYEHEFFQEFKGEKRQKTFICLGQDCPLCAVCGEDHAKFYALINILDLTNPRKPELKVWYLTPQPGGLVEDEMDSLEAKDKVINDPSLYYVVSKKKERNNFYSYSLKAVKARDL